MAKTDTKPQIVPAPSPGATPRRRVFTAEYKAKILEECDAATQPGDIGAILRREGLYSSHLCDWRRTRAAGGTAALSRKRGRPPKDPELQAERKENERLRGQIARLEEKLRRAEIIQDAQKKLAELLAPLADPPSESSS